MKTFTLKSNQYAKGNQPNWLIDGFAKIVGANAVKHILALVAFLLLSSGVWGQKTLTAGTATYNGIWSGGTWSPSAPVAGDDILLSAGTTMNINSSFSINRITLSSNSLTTPTNLAVGTGAVLTVTNDVLLNSANGVNTSCTLSGLGTINCNSLMVGSDVTPTASCSTILTSTLSNLNVTTNLTLRSDFANANMRNNPTFTQTSGSLDVLGSIVTVNNNANTMTYTMGNSSPILHLSGATPFALDVAGTSTITLNGTGSAVYYDYGGDQAIRGTTYINLYVAGSGTKTLSANTTVSTALTVNAGCTLGLSTFTLGSPTATTLYCGAAAGSTISGSGLFTLGGNVTVNDDASVGTNGATISCPVALGGTRTFTVADDGSAATDFTISGIVSTANGITKTGLGTIMLSGANTYSGATSINNGTLMLNNTAAFGTSSATTVGAGAVLDLNGITLSTARALTLNGTGLASLPAGALTNSGANATYSGAITVGGAGGATITATTSGTLTCTGAVGGNNFPLTLDGVATSSGTMSGIIGTTGGTITKNGAGTWTLSGANTYTGVTTVNGGTLKAGIITNAFGTGSNVTLANAAGVILDLNNFSNTIGSLAGGGALGGNVTLGSATLTMGNTSTTAYAGVISGTGAVTKNGTGALTLSGASTYSGGTTLGLGILNINNSQALGVAAGRFTINGGSIDNTSGNAITTVDYPQTWGGSILYGGTNNLNLGYGAVYLYAVDMQVISAILHTVNE